MKLYMGQFIEQKTGVVKERYLIFGRVIDDAKFDSVGKEASPRLRFAISPGRYEDLCNVCAWKSEAVKYRNIRKGDIVLVDALEQKGHSGEKTYLNYIPMNMMVHYFGGEDSASMPAMPTPMQPPNYEPFGEDGFVDIDEKEVFG